MVKISWKLLFLFRSYFLKLKWGKHHGAHWCFVWRLTLKTAFQLCIYTHEKMNNRLTMSLNSYPHMQWTPPLHPTFMKWNWGWTTVIHYFLMFFLSNIDCGYSLEPHNRGGSNVYPRSMFLSKDKKSILFFHLKITIFYSRQNIAVYCTDMFV